MNLNKDLSDELKRISERYLEKSATFLKASKEYRKRNPQKLGNYCTNIDVSFPDNRICNIRESSMVLRSSILSAVRKFGDLEILSFEKPKVDFRVNFCFGHETIPVRREYFDSYLKDNDGYQRLKRFLD